ncbi:MAG: hypothetical protein R2838_05825 [Caldilineaceae bacterium]
MIFPKLNALSYWLYLFGGLFLYSSFFFGGAPCRLVQLCAHDRTSSRPDTASTSAVHSHPRHLDHGRGHQFPW